MSLIAETSGGFLPKDALPLEAVLDGNVPIPPIDMLKYLREQKTLEYKGLALHILTTTTVLHELIQAINEANRGKPANKQISANFDESIGIKVAYHIPRPLADRGKQDQASPAINEFMKTHDDIELARTMAILQGLPLPIVDGIEKLMRDRGFPYKTVGPDNRYHPNQIDWTVALTQVSSWLVAGSVVPMKTRFDDLIARHGGQKTSKDLSKDELLAYKAWGMARLQDLCDHLGIENVADFNDWLKNRLFTRFGDPEKAQEKSDQLIRQLFDKEPKAYEFLPVSPAYEYIARCLMYEGEKQRDKTLPLKIMEGKRLLKIFLRKPQSVLAISTQTKPSTDKAVN
jgi:hypothetical protein